MNSNWKFFVFFSFHLQLTNTNTSGIVKYGSISAFAPITTDHVDTLAVGTCVNAEFSTFVNVLANICGRVQLRSSWTDALRYQKRLRFLWWTNQLDFVFFLLGNFPVCYDTVLHHKEDCRRRIRLCPCKFYPNYQPDIQDCKYNDMFPASSRKLHWCKYLDSGRIR